MSRREQFTVGELLMNGVVVGAVTVLARNSSGLVTMCKCATGSIPSTVAGYAKGCLLVDTTTGAISTNTGSTTSCTFVALTSVTAGSVVTTSIADANVTLAKLAAGITPSHVVKYAGKVTWSGAGATLASTVAGVLSTDVVMATVQVKGTQTVYLVSAIPTTDTITFTLSTANTSNDTVVAYTVFRAAA